MLSGETRQGAKTSKIHDPWPCRWLRSVHTVPCFGRQGCFVTGCICFLQSLVRNLFLGGFLQAGNQQSHDFARFAKVLNFNRDTSSLSECRSMNQRVNYIGLSTLPGLRSKVHPYRTLVIHYGEVQDLLYHGSFNREENICGTQFERTS